VAPMQVSEPPAQRTSAYGAFQIGAMPHVQQPATAGRQTEELARKGIVSEAWSRFCL
jgi:hypothetical protein